MIRNIKISIIIPVYNTEKYIKKCLESIIVQQLKEVEIICVNDGSTDNSLEVLKQYQNIDNRIVIIDKKNGGASSARNMALNIARGEYCLNIDSDDWIEQNYLKDMYERAKKDNLDIVISDIVKDYKVTNKKIIIKDLNISNNKIINGLEYIKLFFTVNGYGYTCNKLIKRELYEENNIRYNEDIFLLEDTEVLCKLAYFSKKIGKLNKAYYHYIQWENNGSTQARVKSLNDIFICMENLIIFYTEKKQFEIVNLIREDKNIHLLARSIENDYLEKEEYSKFIDKFVKSIKNENELYYKEDKYKGVYKRFLVFSYYLAKYFGKNGISCAKFILKIKKKAIKR